MNKYAKVKLFIAGFLFGDAINHLLLGINHSKLSVHGVEIGISGNWIAVLLEVIIIGFLLIKNNKYEK